MKQTKKLRKGENRKISRRFKMTSGGHTLDFMSNILIDSPNKKAHGPKGLIDNLKKKYSSTKNNKDRQKILHEFQCELNTENILENLIKEKKTYNVRRMLNGQGLMKQTGIFNFNGPKYQEEKIIIPPEKYEKVLPVAPPARPSAPVPVKNVQEELKTSTEKFGFCLAYKLSKLEYDEKIHKKINEIHDTWRHDQLSGTVDINNAWNLYNRFYDSPEKLPRPYRGTKSTFTVDKVNDIFHNVQSEINNFTLNKEILYSLVYKNISAHIIKIENKILTKQKLDPAFKILNVKNVPDSIKQCIVGLNRLFAFPMPPSPSTIRNRLFSLLKNEESSLTYLKDTAIQIPFIQLHFSFEKDNMVCYRENRNKKAYQGRKFMEEPSMLQNQLADEMKWDLDRNICKLEKYIFKAFSLNLEDTNDISKTLKCFSNCVLNTAYESHLYAILKKINKEDSYWLNDKWNSFVDFVSEYKIYAESDLTNLEKKWDNAQSIYANCVKDKKIENNSVDLKIIKDDTNCLSNLERTLSDIQVSGNSQNIYDEEQISHDNDVGYLNLLKFDGSSEDFNINEAISTFEYNIKKKIYTVLIEIQKKKETVNQLIILSKNIIQLYNDPLTKINVESYQNSKIKTDAIDGDIIDDGNMMDEMIFEIEPDMTVYYALLGNGKLQLKLEELCQLLGCAPSTACSDEGFESIYKDKDNETLINILNDKKDAGIDQWYQFISGLVNNKTSYLISYFNVNQKISKLRASIEDAMTENVIKYQEAIALAINLESKIQQTGDEMDDDMKLCIANMKTKLNRKIEKIGEVLWNESQSGSKDDSMSINRDALAKCVLQSRLIADEISNMINNGLPQVIIDMTEYNFSSNKGIIDSIKSSAPPASLPADHANFFNLQETFIRALRENKYTLAVKKGNQYINRTEDLTATLGFSIIAKDAGPDFYIKKKLKDIFSDIYQEYKQQRAKFIEDNTETTPEINNIIKNPFYLVEITDAKTELVTDLANVYTEIYTQFTQLTPAERERLKLKNAPIKSNYKYKASQGDDHIFNYDKFMNTINESDYVSLETTPSLKNILTSDVFFSNVNTNERLKVEIINQGYSLFNPNVWHPDSNLYNGILLRHIDAINKSWEIVELWNFQNKNMPIPINELTINTDRFEETQRPKLLGKLKVSPEMTVKYSEPIAEYQDQLVKFKEIHSSVQVPILKNRFENFTAEERFFLFKPNETERLRFKELPEGELDSTMDLCESVDFLAKVNVFPGWKELKEAAEKINSKIKDLVDE